MAAEKRYNTRPPKQTHVRIKEEPYDEGYNLQNGGSCYHNNYSPMTKRIKLEHGKIDRNFFLHLGCFFKTSPTPLMFIMLAASVMGRKLVHGG